MLCGRNVECDWDTYTSELNSARNNRKILEKLLRESGVNCAEISTENILKFYTSVSFTRLNLKYKMTFLCFCMQCCALLVNTKQLADIGVMLAQNGMTRSGLQILELDAAKLCLVQMMQAGLYEESGDFFGLTGIVAKSGVSGGIVAVAHKKMAIGLFSPKINSYGNSVRSIAFLKVRFKISYILYLLSACSLQYIFITK